MKGEVRNPTTVWLVAIFTCGLGPLYYFYTMFNELKNYLGRDDINPIVELLIAWVCAPYALMRLGGYIQEAKQRAGVANAENNWVNYLLFLLLCGFGWAKIQEDLNVVWQGGGGAPATF
jgi:hypothetical protein